MYPSNVKHRQVFITILVLLGLLLPSTILAEAQSRAAAKPAPATTGTTEQSDESTLTVDVDFFDFFALEGGDSPESQSFTVSSSDGTPVNWEAFVWYEDEFEEELFVDWLTLDIDIGTVSTTTTTVNVSVDSSELSEGIYFATIFVEDVDNLYDWFIDVYLEIGGDSEPILFIDPFYLAFEADQGGANPPAQSFTVENIGAVDFEFVVEPLDDWITVTPDNGTATAGTPATISVAVDAAGLESGFYIAEVDVVDLETFYYETVIVELLVKGDVNLQVNPNTFAFTTLQGQAITATQTLNVSATGNDELEWFAFNEQAWLILEYDAEDYNKLYVGLDSQQLAAGVYTDTITVESNGGRSEIPVNLTVQSPAEANVTEDLPNLIVEEFRTEPETPAPGQPVTIIATIKNDGFTATDAAFYVDLFVNPETPPKAGVDWTSVSSNINPAVGIEWEIGTALAAGQSVTLRSDNTDGSAIAPLADYTTWSGNFPTGVTEMVLVADSWEGNSSPNGSLLEGNESDNIVRKSFTSGGTPPPPPTADLQLYGLEVTQAVQDLKNSVGLIKDKSTFVRAHVRSGNTTISGVAGRLKGTRDGVDLPGSPLSPINDGGKIDVLTEPNRIRLNDSFLFELPEAWRNGNVTLTFEGVSHQIGCAEVAGTPNDCQVAVTFEEVKPLPITFIKVNWTDPDGTVHSLTDEEFQLAIRDTIAQMPVPSLEYTVSAQTITVKRSDNFLYEVLPAVSAIRAKEGNPNRLYYGLLGDWRTYCTGRCTAGLAYTPGTSGSGFGIQTTTPHEIGHNLGRSHVGCDGTEKLRDQTPPYPADRKGRISLAQEGDDAFYGFDIFSKRIYPPNSGELMAYCQPSWVSDFHYNLFKAEILKRYNQPVNDDPFVHSAQAVPALLVSGRVGAEGAAQGSFTDLFDLDVAAIPTPAATGAYTLRLEDAAGQALATIPFDSEPISEEGDEPFALVVAKPANLAKLVLLQNGQTLATRTATANAPTVTVTSPNGGETLTGNTTVTWTASDSDGDSLRYLVEYSSDNGATWSILGTGLTETSLKVDATALLGSTQALIRVQASDGINTGSDQSDASFTVVNKTPTAAIGTPTGQRFVGKQTITLIGSGIDPEDGVLRNASLSWSSTRNGRLGSGETLVLAADKFKEGQHTISLTARDKSGAVATATITVNIRRNAGVIPAALGVYPPAIDSVIDITAGQTDTRVVSVANDGDGTVGWNASTTQSWLSLSSNSGTAPDSVTVTFDATGLAPGDHSDTITFTDARSGATREVAVNLVVNDSSAPQNQLYLPIVIR